ncbi:MAG: hypothetical protein BHW45_00170 [Roseburia sp. CAG:197_41_10]|jgi:hypothetical protein|nr:MAG: hypothetical protein BHW45_00170 [Roseburia sp. CAG:197_41_10]
MQKIFTVIIITLNTIGVFFFTGMDFPIFGIALSILSILCSIFFSEYVWMHVFATTVIRSHNIGKYFSKGNANRIVISVAFLSLAVKIGVLIKTGIYLVALLLVTVAILLASGFFFEGRSSGMSITGAYNISKILLKIYSFIEPVIKWCDTLFEWIIKGEYKILGIEVQGE